MSQAHDAPLVTEGTGKRRFLRRRSQEDPQQAEMNYLRDTIVDREQQVARRHHRTYFANVLVYRFVVSWLFSWCRLEKRIKKEGKKQQQPQQPQQPQQQQPGGTPQNLQ